MKIKLEDSVLLVVDIQERLLPAMHEKEELFANCMKLFKGAKVLNVPTVITQQYPKGLGTIYKEILDELPDAKLFDKMAFSSLTDEVLSELNTIGKRNVVVCGIEAHVCVLQTLVDLIDNGFQPILVADCISSRKNESKAYALERAKAEGVIITTAESLLFEFIVTAEHKNFKEISRIIK